MPFGCQTENARLIRKGEGHYLLAVKGNQPTLHEAVQAVFERADAARFEGLRFDHHTTAEVGHGRHEERSVSVIYEPDGLPPGEEPPPNPPPGVLCVRCKDFPPTYVVPPAAKVLRCVGCEAKVYALPSTARHVANGEMRPVCPHCAPEGVSLLGMTAEQVEDLAKMDEAAGNN